MRVLGSIRQRMDIMSKHIQNLQACPNELKIPLKVGGSVANCPTPEVRTSRFYQELFDLAPEVGLVPLDFINFQE